MIEEKGRVVATEDGFAWVLTFSQSACHSCSAKAGCGQKLLSHMSGGHAQQLKVANNLDVAVGDKVYVGISEQALLQTSLLVYCVPLLLFILCSGTAYSWLAESDGIAMLAGLTGLISGLFIVKILSFKLSCNPAYHPQLLRKTS
jgi:sigma-E factor negative regulatory protein RseC